MKVRSGFVSNSSTSSFCIYGTRLESSDLNKIRKNLDIKIDDIEDYGDIESAMAKLQYQSTIRGSGECGSIYIGKSWSNIRDTETGRQFKDRIEAEIAKLLGKTVSCQTHSRAWYNG